MISAILLFFIETKIGRAIAIVTGAVAIVVASWITFKVHYENVGYQKAIHLIAIQDAKTKATAKEAQDEVAKCFASGGTWDVSAGGPLAYGGLCVH